MRFSKKASLNLSINAIVVLILAITMLGLGLGFMRNIFGGATRQFEEVSGTVKKQMIEQMKETNKIVDLSRPKVEMKIGEKKQIFIGFKNDQVDPIQFRISDETECNVIGGDEECGIREESDVWIEYLQNDITVNPGEVKVLPINIESMASTKEENTFFFDIIVDVGDNTKNVQFTVDLTV